MFLLLFIAVPVIEVLAFVEVGLAIGWLWALALLITTSVVGVGIAKREGRAAIKEVRRAFSEGRPPGGAVLDGALGSIGGLLLAIPGFVTDALGALLLVPPARRLARRWLSGRYGARFVRMAAGARRSSRGAPRRPPADVDSTAFEDDIGGLPR
jgi:UPF0716 protein FxsA